MGALSVIRLAILPDSANYTFLIHDAASGQTAVVDPGDAGPVQEECQRRGWRLTHIWNTHHHHDHVGGNLALKAATGCTVIGSAVDAGRIPGLDRTVADGDSFDIGGHPVQVLGVSGHTIGHIAFYLPDAAALFCGDTLFSLGCGRMFEGSPQQFWQALSRLRALPDDTLVYCAHEYTESNLRFALSIEPDHPVLKQRALVITALRYQGVPTVPCLLGEEKASNPFLRVDQPELAALLGRDAGDPAAVFAELRRRKDGFS